MTFGEYLKMLRMKKGFTLRSLSDEISLSFTYLCDIENNKKTAPNDVALLQISKVLNLNEEEQIIFFDIAANSKSLKDKNNFHIPTDIGEYISSNDKIKKDLRKQIANNTNNNQ